ncbi:hypothetical protein [Marivirga tractuosa]
MYKVVDYVFSYLHVKEIGIGDVKKLVSKDISDVDILLSLQKLCLLHPPLLSLNYEFFENEDTYYPLSNSDVKAAEETGFLTHPYTGELLPEDIYSKRIFMFYKVNVRS